MSVPLRVRRHLNPDYGVLTLSGSPVAVTTGEHWGPYRVPLEVEWYLPGDPAVDGHLDATGTFVLDVDTAHDESGLFMVGAPGMHGLFPTRRCAFDWASARWASGSWSAIPLRTVER